MLAAERVPVFEAQIREVILGMVRGRLRTMRRTPRELSVPVELTEEFLSGAYLGVIRWWPEAGLPHDPEHMALWLALLGPAAALGLTVKPADACPPPTKHRRGRDSPPSACPPATDA